MPIMPNYKRAKFFCLLSFLLYHSGYKDVSECWNCTAGFHCSQPGRNSPVGPCDAGYYCPVGSASPRQIPCPPGAYCEGTSEEPKLCPSGTYQPNFTRTSINDCTSCTAGWVIFHFCLMSFAMECGWFCSDVGEICSFCDRLFNSSLIRKGLSGLPYETSFCVINNNY